MDYCKTLLDQMVVLGCPSLIGPVYSVVGKADAVEPAQQKMEWALVVKNVASGKRRLVQVPDQDLVVE